MPTAVDESTAADGVFEHVPADLVEALAGVVDPRARRGVRHRFGTILAIGVCAVPAGARSFTAIGEWACDLTPTVRLRLGLGRRAPSESTIRRVLQRVDPVGLDRVVSAWLAGRITTGQTLPGLVTVNCWWSTKPLGHARPPLGVCITMRLGCCKPISWPLTWQRWNVTWEKRVTGRI